MQTRNRLFDDLARAAGGAFSTAAGLREEVEAQIRQQLERILSRLDLVTREEFDAVKDMAAKAREEQELLGERLAALESARADSRPPAKPPARKAAARKATAKPGAAAKNPRSKAK